MEKVSFEFLGLILMEPLSTLMNWILAVQCVWYYQKLKRGHATVFQRYWSWFFLAYAISLGFGGFSHLLYEYTGMMGKVPGWSLALLGVVAGELAMVTGITDEKKKRMLHTVIRSKLFATAVMLIFDFSFKWVMMHTAGLLLFVGTISYNRRKAGQLNYKYFLFGIGMLVLMAAVKIVGVDLHPAWFNRNDIAHVLMAGTYWMFYRGVSRIEKSF